MGMQREGANPGRRQSSPAAASSLIPLTGALAIKCAQHDPLTLQVAYRLDPVQCHAADNYQRLPTWRKVYWRPLTESSSTTCEQSSSSLRFRLRPMTVTSSALQAGACWETPQDVCQHFSSFPPAVCNANCYVRSSQDSLLVSPICSATSVTHYLAAQSAQRRACAR